MVECEAEKQSVPLYGKRPYRGVDRRKFENEVECCTALIHEDGHFESGAFYKPFSVLPGGSSRPKTKPGGAPSGNESHGAS